jgi:hypothetical protein
LGGEVKQGRLISKRTAISKKIKDISPLARAYYLAAIPHRDDMGRIDGDPESFKAIVAPMWPEPVGQVSAAIDEMVQIRLADRYSANGYTVLEFTKDEELGIWRLDLLRKAEYPNRRGKRETKEWDKDAKKWRIRDES